jgi:predicted Rossmann fold nucleotide-binding protein DprA/Smf involved in DNA uptake
MKASAVISSADSEILASLRQRLGAHVPARVFTIGNADLLAFPKTALFCSIRCPGHAILPAYDQAAKWRDTGRCVISGFHSPVEKECLRILLRGSQPIIICPARTLPLRVPPDWQKPLAAGRLLIVSAFTATFTRITAELASRRNDFVAALADEVWFAHIEPSGELERLSNCVCAWAVQPPIVNISRRDHVNVHF